MSYQKALNAFVIEQLEEKYAREGLDHLHVTELLNVDVTWDDGERYDPTYGGSSTTPTFEIRATFRSSDGQIDVKLLDTAMTMSALLKALLGMEV